MKEEDYEGYVDPVVAGIRAIREAYAKEFNYDIDAMFEDLRASQAASGLKYVSYPFKPGDFPAQNPASDSPAKGESSQKRSTDHHKSAD